MSIATPLSIERLREAYAERGGTIRARLAEFARLRGAPKEVLLSELAFCIFAAGSSAEMGLRSVERLGPLLHHGTVSEMAAALKGLRFPNARAGYIAHTREYLRDLCDLNLGPWLESFATPLERRRFLAETRGIKGIGYKEASHFLRNVGYTGYAILDKHILGCLAELAVVSSPAPPKRPAQYLETEALLRNLAARVGVSMDELDLLLWSERTGRIVK
ncbi:MAG TPA: N-glycosylase [Armatimonadota bacterium]